MYRSMIESQGLGGDVGHLMVSLFVSLRMLSQPALVRQLYRIRPLCLLTGTILDLKTMQQAGEGIYTSPCRAMK